MQAWNIEQEMQGGYVCTLSTSYISDKEKQDGCSCVVEVDAPQTTIKNPNGSKVTTFTYDYSYFQDAKSVNFYY
jgi:hypothetical protein